MYEIQNTDHIDLKEGFSSHYGESSIVPRLHLQTLKKDRYIIMSIEVQKMAIYGDKWQMGDPFVNNTQEIWLSTIHYLFFNCR